MSFITVIERVAGINNKLDTKSVKTLESGHVYVAEAVNIDIDDTGAISRRCGRVSLSSVPSHSLYEDFVTQDRASDSALYKINQDYSLSGIRSGLMKGNRLSMVTVGSKTYYQNGAQSGVIEGTTSTPWPDTTEHFGAETTRAFYPAPFGGTHIAYFLGCWWIAKGNTIFVSEFRSPGKYDLLGKRFSFGSDVRMVRPVTGGVWVSDAEQTGFIARADDFKVMTWAKKGVAAHEWSDTQPIEIPGIPGLSAVWSCNDGLCIGTVDGQLIVRTKDDVKYPAGSYGATVATENFIINSIW